MNAQVKSSNTALDIFKWLIVVLLVGAAVGGNYYFSAESLIYRVIGVLALLIIAVLVASVTEKGKSIDRLRKEAWVEIRKVIWPTRQETIQTTSVVIGFIIIVALILWALDTLFGYLISLAIG